MKTRPRTNLNGGDLVRSTFLVLTFTFTLAFMATFVLAFILAFLSHPSFGAFGWAFARAHSGLRRRFAFHWSLLKAPIYCARRGSRGGRSPCRR